MRLQKCLNNRVKISQMCFLDSIYMIHICSMFSSLVSVFTGVGEAVKN